MTEVRYRATSETGRVIIVVVVTNVVISIGTVERRCRQVSKAMSEQNGRQEYFRDGETLDQKTSW